MNGGNCCCNILWLIFGGFFLGLSWCFLGLIWCITIIGIPFGTQAFKIGIFIFWPFGKEIVEKEGGSSGIDCILNVVWFIFGGAFLCIASAIDGVLFCISIFGIPCGLQLFKLAGVACAPFGKEIIESKPIVRNLQPTNIQLMTPSSNIQVINVNQQPLVPGNTVTSK